MSCATQYNVYSYFFKKHLIYQKFPLVLSMLPVAAHGHITSTIKLEFVMVRRLKNI
jgi:hypothetical protein